MNSNISGTCNRAQAIECSKAQQDLSFSRDDELSHWHPLWIPEDIAEPEPWGLASFSDLLPHEMA